MRTEEVVPRQFQWTPQPAAEAWVRQRLNHVLDVLPHARKLSDRFHSEAGVRLVDMIDTIVLADDPDAIRDAERAGWTRDSSGIYRNATGIFPLIAVERKFPPARIAIQLKVESAA